MVVWIRWRKLRWRSRFWVQIYDDDLMPVLEYLRVILGGATVLVNSMDHMIPGTETNVMDVIGGSDSSRYVVAVTAVRSATALFPDYLAEDMHKMQNLDAIGDVAGVPLAGDFATDAEIEADEDHEKESTMKNVGDLTVANSQPGLVQLSERPPHVGADFQRLGWHGPDRVLGHQCSDSHGSCC